MHEIGNSEECDGGQSRTQARPKRVNDGPWWTNHIYLCRRPHGASADESGKSAKRETGPKRRVPILQSSSFIVWFEGTLPDLSVGSADPSKTARLANRTRPTADMSAHEFQGWLTKFAECVEKCGRSRVLVDSTTFRMSPANMDGPWRDANIIPRYNAAGVAKFAFHMPEGMPMIGKPPARETPGQFPTGYFSSRQAAMDWLAG